MEIAAAQRNGLSIVGAKGSRRIMARGAGELARGRERWIAEERAAERAERLGSCESLGPRQRLAIARRRNGGGEKRRGEGEDVDGNVGHGT